MVPPIMPLPQQPNPYNQSDAYQQNSLNMSSGLESKQHGGFNGFPPMPPPHIMAQFNPQQMMMPPPGMNPNMIGLPNLPQMGNLPYLPPAMMMPPPPGMMMMPPPGMPPSGMLGHLPPRNE